MLKCECINPEIMEALAYCGHGSKILIADANYPLEDKAGGRHIYLGLKRGLPTATDVLETLATAVAIEKAEVMIPGKYDTDPDGSRLVREYMKEADEPEVFAPFRKITGLDLYAYGRYPFYKAAMGEDVSLSILTGEGRTFSNILLTVGCS